MSDMRKFQHHTVVRSVGPLGVDLTRTWGVDPYSASKPQFSTVPTHLSRASVVDAVRSLTLFPDAKSILSRLSSDGLRSDWAMVGCDLRSAMDQWSSANAPARSERKVA